MKKQTLKELLKELEKANEENEIEVCNQLTEEIENRLNFKNKEQHEKWLDILFTYVVWEDFCSFTLSIGEKKEYKKADLWHIINRKDCAGVIVKNTTNDKYWFQNSNDMGFIFQYPYGEYEETYKKETILRKIKIAKRLFIYELENTECEYPEEDLVSYQEAVDYIKECFKHIIGAKNEK